MTGQADHFPGFKTWDFDLGDVSIHARIGGRGPPLVLLHGYPQSHLAWHRVAFDLAREFSVIALDLRGYGQSSCPPSDSEHRAYSKRTMAGDVLRIMDRMGHHRFRVMGHDRGARVAYRLALDAPERVERLALIDIVTTYDQWQPALQVARKRIDHWAFLAQPAPIPETLIGANPVEWLEGRIKRGTANRSLDAIEPTVLDAYRQTNSDRDRVNATCEDYRAGAGCDLADDTQDRAAGRKIAAPTLVVVASSGSIAEIADPLTLWQPWCRDVACVTVESGHFVPEENPQGLLDCVLPFLSQS